MTSKERAELRAQANTLDAILMVGKGGVSETLVAEAEKLLDARELVKGRVLESALMSAREVCDVLCEQTGAELNLEVGYGAVPAVQPRCCQEFNLIDPVRQADVVVSVGKLKTHCMTGLSGGVKKEILFARVSNEIEYLEFKWFKP